jgi:N-acetylglutamate synthase-like GNAT family acetyltransferase
MIHQAFLKKFWMLQKGSEVRGCVSLSSSDTDVCILSILMQIVLPLCDPADESLITSEQL